MAYRPPLNVRAASCRILPSIGLRRLVATGRRSVHCVSWEEFKVASTAKLPKPMMGWLKKPKE